MEGICVYMGGSQCAENYCDMWNNEHQSCSKALESHRRVEILTMILERADDLVANAKDKEELMKVVKDLNIVKSNGTIN